MKSLSEYIIKSDIVNINETYNDKGYSNYFKSVSEFYDAIDDNAKQIDLLFKDIDKRNIKSFIEDIYKGAANYKEGIDNKFDTWPNSYNENTEFSFSDVPLIWNKTGHIKLKRKYEGTVIQNIYDDNRQILKYKYIIGNGSITGQNAGESFEPDYIADICSDNSRYREKLLEVIRKDDKYKDIFIKFDDITVKHEGSKNSKRPLLLTNNNELVVANTGSKDDNIGNIISDVTITPTDDEKDNIYLSLKSGDKITFCNCGINNDNFFKHSCFDKKTKFGKLGESLLKLFYIDEELFRLIFLTYNKEKNSSNKEYIDITDKLNNNEKNDNDMPGNKDLFMKLCKSAIGYGYILVHQSKGKIHYYDLRNSENLDKLLGNNIKEAIISYNLGYTKRIDINIKMDNIDWQFNIRSKDGSIYPTHFLADYKIKNNITI